MSEFVKCRAQLIANYEAEFVQNHIVGYSTYNIFPILLKEG